MVALLYLYVVIIPFLRTPLTLDDEPDDGGGGEQHCCSSDVVVAATVFAPLDPCCCCCMSSVALRPPWDEGTGPTPIPDDGDISMVLAAAVAAADGPPAC